MRLIGVVKVLSIVEFFLNKNLFFEIFQLNQSKPSNFDYPKSIFFLFAVEQTHLIQKNPSKMPRLSKQATLKREYESLAECWVKKAYVHFCFDDEDSSEDDRLLHIGRVSCVAGITVLFMRSV